MAFMIVHDLIYILAYKITQYRTPNPNNKPKPQHTYILVQIKYLSISLDVELFCAELDKNPDPPRLAIYPVLYRLCCFL